jgi:lysozyme
VAVVALATCSRATIARAAKPRRPPLLEGIDVSRYQGEIDWRRVKQSGVVFAFIRVSDGSDTIDERFADNFRAAGKAGLRRGAYQFFRAGEDALAQANLIVDTVRKLGRADLPLVVDVESDDWATDPALQNALLMWLERVEKRTRRRPIIYTSPAMGTRLGARFAAWPLWIAHYDVDAPRLPDGWTRWSFWQHSATGRVAGIVGNVDLDRFAGTRAELRRLNRRSERASAAHPRAMRRGSGQALDVARDRP